MDLKGGSRHKNWCMAWVLNFLIRYFSNYYILHRSDLAAWAAPLDPRLETFSFLFLFLLLKERVETHLKRGCETQISKILFLLIVSCVKQYSIDLRLRSHELSITCLEISILTTCIDLTVTDFVVNFQITLWQEINSDNFQWLSREL